MQELIGISIIIIGLNIIAHSDYGYRSKEYAHYCAMTDTWLRFKGTRGHPNYEARDCSNKPGNAGDVRRQ